MEQESGERADARPDPAIFSSVSGSSLSSQGQYQTSVCGCFWALAFPCLLPRILSNRQAV